MVMLRISIINRFCLAKKALLLFAIILGSLSTYSQAVVRGSVRGSEGELLPGVTIKVKEAPDVVTVSNAKGRYSLDVLPAYKTLIFSHVGYKTKNVEIAAREIIHVTLELAATGLNEIVVTGYKSTARKDLTGAIGIVDMDDMQKAPVSSFEAALAGRVAGVQVTSQNGKPGSEININIRGVGSISQSNSPLFVIDGVAMEDPDNSLITPDNIKSISILKDASSTAIYGARGSNGVVVITTKRGKKGGAKVSYSGNYGVNKPVKFMKLLSPYEFVKVISDHYGAEDNPYLVNGLTLEDYRYVIGTDWQTELLRNGTQQNHYIRLYGGSEGTLYSISGNILDEEGIVINSGYKRYQGKMTLDQDVGDKVTVGGSITYTGSTVTGTNPTGYVTNALFYHAYTYRPIPIPGIDMADFESSLYDPSNGFGDYRINPILSAKNEIRNRVTHNTIGSIYLKYNILKNLKLTVRGAINSNMVRTEGFNGTKTRTGGPRGSSGVNGYLNNYKYEVYDNTNLLEYETTINEKHNINVLLGTGLQKVISRGNGYSATHIPDETMGLSGLDAGEIDLTPLGYIRSNALVSGFGSINYIFDKKYYFTANFRADGSSKFVGENRWGYFPSAAVKWKFSEEKFFQNQSILSDGNIRFSYGETGNNRVGYFDTYATIRFYSPLFLNGVSQGNSAVTTSLANPDLRWETSTSMDLGIDLGFFKNRLNLTVDIYEKVTNDLLYRTSLPGSTGYGSTIKNIASIENRGLEITVSGDIIQRKDFSYSSSFNISFNRNRLKSLADPSEEAIVSTVSWEAAFSNLPAYIAEINGPLGQIYGYISDGLYQYEDFDKLPDGSYVLKPNQPTFIQAVYPGSPKYVDLNGDGAITEVDRTVLGNGYPLHVGGWSNNFKYKNFDLNLFFQWSYGNHIINANRLWFDPGVGIKYRSSIFSGQNTFAAFADRWTSTNQNTDIPYLLGSTVVYASQYVEDGSYLRLKTLNIGYTLPSELLSRYNISKLRIYIATNNLFTWTKYKGYDPEVAAFQTGLTPSLDYSTYPRPLTITGGINITL